MRPVLLIAVLLTVGLGGATNAAAQAPGDVTVSVEPTTSSIMLGESLDLHVTVTNNATAPIPELVVHLDVTDPTISTSVDPEDWTSTLTRPVGVLAPQATITLDWTVQPIAGGTFAVYAVALSADQAAVSPSNILRVEVQDRRVLNPGGILPVALGAPALVGALLVLQLRLVRRTHRRGPPRP